MTTTRRKFLKMTGCGLGAAALPLGGMRVAFAKIPQETIFVNIYLRGGADSLYMVAPTPAAFATTNEKNFYLNTDLNPDNKKNKESMGRELFFNDIGSEFTYKGIDNTGASLAWVDNPAVSTPGLPLAGSDYMLHPNLSYFQNLFNNNNMTILHGVGGVGSHSHFSAQDASEWAKPASKHNVLHHGGTSSGWLYDAVNQLGSGPLSGTAMSASMPQVFAANGGAINRVTALSGIDNFTFGSNDAEREMVKALYSDDYSGSSSALRRVGEAGQQAMSVMDVLSSADTPSINDALWPATNDTFYRRLQDAARLIKKKNTHIRCINVDATMTWDTHKSQIEQQFTNTEKLNLGLQGFMAELGAAYDTKICVLLMTEFGRTLDVNGTQGTDHGEGGAMFVIHKGVDATGNKVMNGGKVKGANWNWPVGNGIGISGSSRGWLHSGGRYYTPTTYDFRAIYAELLKNTNVMGLTDTQIKNLFGASSLVDGSGDSVTFDPAFGRESPNLFT